MNENIKHGGIIYYIVDSDGSTTWYINGKEYINEEEFKVKFLEFYKDNY